VAGDDTLFMPSRLLLARALSAARAAGARIGWPSGAQEDSLMFELEYRVPEIRPPGTVRPMRARLAVPVFSMARPWRTEVEVRRPPSVTYPSEPRGAWVEGNVMLEFVVDTAGRLAPGPIKDIWPAGRPRLTGDEGAWYEDFIAAARRGLYAARFAPATVGGCPVPQLEQMPFTFNLRR
jgi:hypothetical protein